MRIRLRAPSGQSVINIDETATVKDLQAQISKETSLQSFDVKYGYPPKALPLEQYKPTDQLSSLDVKLNGESLIISSKERRPSRSAGEASSSQTSSSAAASTPSSSQKSQGDSQSSQSTTKSGGGFSFGGVGVAPEPERSKPPPPSKPAAAPLSLNRKQTGVESDPPEVPLAEMGGTLVLRIMPDDNSCLFRAVGNAVLGGMDTMTELRSIIAQTIQANQDDYPEVVLERKPDDYCKWIQTEDAWGGGIELSILSKHFDIEICSIDVQSLRVDRFNEGRPTRCIVVYSGIHYDTIALSPSDPPYTKSYAPPEFDTKTFDAADPVVLEKAGEICRILQGRHYFTDTAAFHIRCNVCGGQFVGEKGATEHASKTGHMDFGEAG